MACISPHTLKELIVRTRARFREIDHADWDGRHYRTPDTQKWEQAAREIAPAEWVEPVRILAQGWDYYGGSDLPGEGRA
jgi:broad specificity phosphatase PhoE